MSDYRSLEVYRRAYAASIKLHRWLGGRRDDVAEQLRRASKSIAANIAEGCSAVNTTTEAKRFLGMAVRSVDEVKVWLDYCRDLGLFTQQQLSEATQEYGEIGAMLYTLWQRWRSPR
jgi:four helix bundle protein